MTTITAARLRELLHYDPETGEFRWLVRGKARRMDRRAGCTTKVGYVMLRVEGRTYCAHRLAWLHAYGAWPTGVIDHINGDKTDNRTANLRDVDRHLNMQNQRKPQAHNTTGFLGVTVDRSRRTKKFQAALWVNGRPKKIGRYSTAEEASAAYVRAKRQHHPGCTI